MARGKTVQLFLMNGAANGPKKATIGNWTGITYLIPRTDVGELKHREDLKQTGVYLLFGTDDDDVDKVYIGQARERKNGAGVLGRIIEHIGEEKLDYWTHAVALVTSNNSFGPTEISYLENQFTNLAKEAGRYQVTNGNDPSPGTVTEEKEAELDEFIDYARLVIGALGYRVFEPADDVKANNQPLGGAEPTLQLTRHGLVARGRQTADGFVVLSGSQLRALDDFYKSAPDSARKNREKYADRIDSSNVLTSDLLFRSPSGAAAFVCGTSSNGFVDWKMPDGRTLGELERREQQDAEG
ncbi:GIY-YIG nuclease family protein [Trueperella bialowiezensis]|uniref:DUF4357 domain-containing protein n=1 Tax=Trueperella bialowiezensis TaxID=312285 RepID=A0A448PEW3_9ACTO|nr:GIY-YIG nuclease family protein [Trueperella bialowiezensis]VEI13485.1 Uncharacterised protein [Trueperella bialowiezensis]